MEKRLFTEKAFNQRKSPLKLNVLTNITKHNFTISIATVK